MLLALSLLAGLAAAPPAPATTGMEILRQCRAATKDVGGNVDAAIMGAHCLGYLAGIADGHEIVAALKPDARLWCEPAEGLQAEQRAMVVIRFLEKNPNELHKSGRTLVVRAFKAGFPCGGGLFDDVPDDAPAKPKADKRTPDLTL